jgi:hypothetical protein
LVFESLTGASSINEAVVAPIEKKVEIEPIDKAKTTAKVDLNVVILFGGLLCGFGIGWLVGKRRKVEVKEKVSDQGV